VIRRKTNRRHMTGNHHGQTAGMATLLARALDGLLGTHMITQNILVRCLAATVGMMLRHHRGHLPAAGTHHRPGSFVHILASPTSCCSPWPGLAITISGGLDPASQDQHCSARRRLCSPATQPLLARTGVAAIRAQLRSR
jgi:hypothetical protein